MGVEVVIFGIKSILGLDIGPRVLRKPLMGS
jgi:hypothetical protein